MIEQQDSSYRELISRGKWPKTLQVGVVMRRTDWDVKAIKYSHGDIVCEDRNLNEQVEGMGVSWGVPICASLTYPPAHQWGAEQRVGYYQHRISYCTRCGRDNQLGSGPERCTPLPCDCPLGVSWHSLRPAGDGHMDDTRSRLAQFTMVYFKLD